MNKHFSRITLFTALTLSSAVYADGLATCDSGPESGWQSQETLTQQLTAKGWQVRRIKVDQGCYEVYAMNEKGERVEAYFHPQTLESVPIDESKARH
jgi:hypothetical protein